ncbi:hypothetical protein HDU76_002068 [Blyttiomyces sp. JEL0837]|nr:hypothetical protein HDU76_002068 [Blyttiomyces sp. JEL0837]
MDTPPKNFGRLLVDMDVTSVTTGRVTRNSKVNSDRATRSSSSSSADAMLNMMSADDRKTTRDESRQVLRRSRRLTRSGDGMDAIRGHFGRSEVDSTKIDQQQKGKEVEEEEEEEEEDKVMVLIERRRGLSSDEEYENPDQGSRTSTKPTLASQTMEVPQQQQQPLMTTKIERTIKPQRFYASTSTTSLPSFFKTSSLSSTLSHNASFSLPPSSPLLSLGDSGFHSDSGKKPDMHDHDATTNAESHATEQQDEFSPMSPTPSIAKLYDNDEDDAGFDDDFNFQLGQERECSPMNSPPRHAIIQNDQQMSSAKSHAVYWADHLDSQRDASEGSKIVASEDTHVSKAPSSSSAIPSSTFNTTIPSAAKIASRASTSVSTADEQAAPNLGPDFFHDVFDALGSNNGGDILGFDGDKGKDLWVNDKWLESGIAAAFSVDAESAEAAAKAYEAIFVGDGEKGEEVTVDVDVEAVEEVEVEVEEVKPAKKKRTRRNRTSFSRKKKTTRRKSEAAESRASEDPEANVKKEDEDDEGDNEDADKEDEEKDDSYVANDHVEHEDDDPNKLYCLCQTTYDPERFYIQCDVCDLWFHGDCVNVTSEEAADIALWYCLDCEKIRGRRAVFKIRCAAYTLSELLKKAIAEKRKQDDAKAIVEVDTTSLNASDSHGTVTTADPVVDSANDIPTDDTAGTSTSTDPPTLPTSSSPTPSQQLPSTVLHLPSVGMEHTDNSNDPGVPKIPPFLLSTIASGDVSGAFRHPKTCKRYIPASENPIKTQGHHLKAPKGSDVFGNNEEGEGGGHGQVSGGPNTWYCSDGCGIAVANYAVLEAVGRGLVKGFGVGFCERLRELEVGVGVGFWELIGSERGFVDVGSRRGWVEFMKMCCRSVGVVVSGLENGLALSNVGTVGPLEESEATISTSSSSTGLVKRNCQANQQQQQRRAARRFAKLAAEDPAREEQRDLKRLMENVERGDVVRKRVRALEWRQFKIEKAVERAEGLRDGRVVVAGGILNDGKGHGRGDDCGSDAGGFGSSSNNGGGGGGRRRRGTRGSDDGNSNSGDSGGGGKNGNGKKVDVNSTRTLCGYDSRISKEWDVPSGEQWVRLCKRYRIKWVDDDEWGVDSEEEEEDYDCDEMNEEGARGFNGSGRRGSGGDSIVADDEEEDKENSGVGVVSTNGTVVRGAVLVGGKTRNCVGLGKAAGKVCLVRDCEAHEDWECLKVEEVELEIKNEMEILEKLHQEQRCVIDRIRSRRASFEKTIVPRERI